MKNVQTTWILLILHMWAVETPLEIQSCKILPRHGWNLVSIIFSKTHHEIYWVKEFYKMSLFNNIHFLSVFGCGAFPKFTGNRIEGIWPQLRAILLCESTAVRTVLDCVNGLWNDTLPVCYDCTYNILPVCYDCAYDTLPAYWRPILLMLWCYC